MARYKKNDDYSFRTRVSKKKYEEEDSIFDTLKRLLILGAAVCLGGLVSLKAYLMIVPPIANLSDFRPNMVTTFYSSDGEVIKTFNACTFSKVSITDVPKQLQQAIIATEDKNFYNHHGYDLLGLTRSMIENVLAGKVVQGGSTITQQLSRMLFLSNEQTYSRKLKEIIIAAKIEKSLSKDQILEMYLNNVYLGSGSYGVDGAAQTYFNKRLNQLTLAEMALIAGLPQAPSVYSPFNNLDLAKKRRNKVLERMYKMHYIDKDTMKAAQAEEVTLTTMPRYYTLNKAPYFCDYVMRELARLGFTEQEISQGGYKIITTIDYKTQQKANETLLKTLNAWGLKGEKNQAALFSFSPVDGKILAYAGGKNYAESQYDRVTQAIRPPGSAFKPFIYTAAIQKGLTPNDMIDDTPYKLGSWAPHNYGNKYRGRLPLYKALMISSNVCAVRLIEYVGVRAVIQVARVMGINTPLQYDYTIALGSNGVKLFELTRAYGIYASGGYKVEPYAIERVESSRGKILYSAPRARVEKVLETDVAAAMTSMLKMVIKHGTGMAANIGKPSAGKTGTTDDYKDAWFVGYTPSVVTGVWVGNDDNTRMGGLTGGTVPAIIWRDVMRVATEPYGNEEFGYPDVLSTSAKGRAMSQLTSPNTADKNYYDDTNEVAPTEDVVQVNTYQPQQMNEKVLNPQGSTQNQQTHSVPQLTQPPIPTAGQDFNN
ncbi:MAG: PBP1A family penicillin-binding protein [Candidatus Gastranaerophilales bacterium]|nr:PBP1A family penicillin-binding protein [Candidatus Gastranaerophilales bacterium]